MEEIPDDHNVKNKNHNSSELCQEVNIIDSEESDISKEENKWKKEKGSTKSKVKKQKENFS